MSLAQKIAIQTMGDRAVCTLWVNDGENDYNQVQYLAPVLIYCEFDTKNGLTRNRAGSEITFTASFYSELDSSTNQIKEGDRIVSGNHLTDINPIKTS